MSEALDKVRGVRELPLFPLPVVLFPGMPMPLHIFEARYRQLLTDIRAGDNLFGLSYFDASSSDKDIPPTGHVGCVAEVTETQGLPDGRSNVLAVGVVRYQVEDYVERDDPYLVVRVKFFEDEEENSQQLHSDAREVAAMFMRVANAIRVTNDERGNLPDITDTEPQKLSFLVAAAMELEPEVKQQLLELRSTSERLHRLGDFLARVVKSYEERARLHSIAKGNGHGGKNIDLDDN
ncbi:MAG TPA: LON peptidase substrate-binding domain-containing protein [Pyrinomonadaceae bacterium]|jgi:Lon protease-like protein|nr:LON peptidase substrate-binding domain-containing protein [Pyrinomonadaceae bacterium]